MYYRAYNPTCVERKFGNIARKIATKCLIPCCQNENVYYNANIHPDQIPSINLRMTTAAQRADSLSNLSEVSQTHCDEPFVCYLKRNGRKYCNCYNTNRSVNSLSEYKTKCNCKRNCARSNSLKIKQKISGKVEKRRNMLRRVCEYEKIDRSKSISKNRYMVNDKENEYKYEVYGKHLHGHVNIKVEGADNFENLEKLKHVQSNNVDPIRKRISDDDSMNFLFYDVDSENSSRCYIGERSNDARKRDLAKKLFKEDHLSEIKEELQFNYKNQVLKYDSISTSTKSIFIDSEIKGKNYLKLNKINKKKEKPVENYLHNLVKSKRKITAKIIGKLRKFTHSRRNLNELPVSEAKLCRNNESINDSYFETDQFEQVGFNYTPQYSETNILRNNLKILQEKFKTVNTKEMAKNSVDLKVEQPENNCLYFDMAEPYLTVEKELKSKEIAIEQENNPCSSKDSVSLNNQQIFKGRRRLKIERRHTKRRIGFDEDLSSNLQDVSRILKVVHHQHRNYCNSKRPLIKKKCISRRRRFHPAYRKQISNPTSNESHTNTKEWAKYKEFSCRKSAPSNRKSYNRKQNKTSALSPLNPERKRFDDPRKLICWKDDNNFFRLEENYRKEIDWEKIGFEGSEIYVMKMNSNSDQNESDGVYFVKQMNESDATNEKEMIEQTNKQTIEDKIRNCFKGENCAKLRPLNERGKFNGPGDFSKGKQCFYNDHSYFNSANRTIEAYWICSCGQSNPPSMKHECPYGDTFKPCHCDSQESLKKSEECCCYDDSLPSVKGVDGTNLKQNCACDHSAKLEPELVCFYDEPASKDYATEQVCCCYDDTVPLSIKSQKSKRKKVSNCHASIQTRPVKLNQTCRCKEEIKPADDSAIEPEQVCFHDEPARKDSATEQICCCYDDVVPLPIKSKQKWCKDDSLHYAKESKQTCICSQHANEFVSCGASTRKQSCSGTIPLIKSQNTARKPNQCNESVQTVTVKIARKDTPTQTCGCCCKVNKDVPVQTSDTFLKKLQASKKVQTRQFDVFVNIEKKQEYLIEKAWKCKCEPFVYASSVPSTSSFDSLVKSLDEECNKSESGSTTIASECGCECNAPVRVNPVRETPAICSSNSYESMPESASICQCNARRSSEIMHCYKEPVPKTSDICICFYNEESPDEEVRCKRENYLNEKKRCIEENKKEVRDCCCGADDPDERSPRSESLKRNCPKTEPESSCCKFKPVERSCPKTEPESSCYKDEPDQSCPRSESVKRFCVKTEPKSSCCCNKNEPGKRRCSKNEMKSSCCRDKNEPDEKCCSTQSRATDVSGRNAHGTGSPSSHEPSYSKVSGTKDILFTTAVQGDDYTFMNSSNGNDDYPSLDISQNSARARELLKGLNTLYIPETSNMKHEKVTTSKEDLISSAETKPTIDDENKTNEREIFAQKQDHGADSGFISSTTDYISEAEIKSLIPVSVNRKENYSSKFAHSNFSTSCSSTMEKEMTGKSQRNSLRGSFPIFDSKAENIDYKEARKFEQRKTKIPTPMHSYRKIEKPFHTITESKPGYAISKVPNPESSVKRELKNTAMPNVPPSEKKDVTFKNVMSINDEKTKNAKTRSLSSKTANPVKGKTVNTPSVAVPSKDRFQKKSLNFNEKRNYSPRSRYSSSKTGKPEIVLSKPSSKRADLAKKKDYYTSKTKCSSSNNANLNNSIKTKVSKITVPIPEYTRKKENNFADLDKIQLSESQTKENCTSAVKTNNKISFTDDFDIRESEETEDYACEVSGKKNPKKRFLVTVRVKHKVLPKDISKSEEFLQVSSPDDEHENLNNITSENCITYKVKKGASLSKLTNFESKKSTDTCREEYLISKLDLKACRENSRMSQFKDKGYWWDNSSLNILDNYLLTDKRKSFETELIDNSINSATSDLGIKENNNAELEVDFDPISTQELKCKSGNFSNSMVIVSNYICKPEKSSEFSYDIVTNSANVLTLNEEIGANRSEIENIGETKENRDENSHGVVSKKSS